jgi:hypothetical protein
VCLKFDCSKKLNPNNFVPYILPCQPNLSMFLAVIVHLEQIDVPGRAEFVYSVIAVNYDHRLFILLVTGRIFCHS